MFTNISWSHYLIAVAVCLIIYYVWICIKFYSLQFNKKLHRSKILKPGLFKNNFFINEMDVNEKYTGSQNEPVLQAENSFGVAMDNGMDSFQKCTWRISEAIQDATRRKLIKEEICTYLQGILKDYPELKEPQSQSRINEFIISQWNQQDQSIVRESDVLLLWNEVK